MGSEGRGPIRILPESHRRMVGSLDFLLRAWVENNDLWVAIQSDLALAVNRRLAEHGIEIPFPQRDLHLRSVAPEFRRPAQSEREAEESN